MATTLDLGRGMSFPPRVGGDGRVACSADEDNVAEAIEIIVKTELGERLRAPDFGAGLATFLFEPNTTVTRRQIQDRITQALTRWEPRIVLDEVEVEEDPGTPTTVLASLRYRLVATDRTQRADVTVFLGA
jgi:phage baseplate assembly protein W